MRTLLVGLIVFAVVPLGAASSPPVSYGTQSDPEIVDGAGDVRYDNAHLGDRNHTYLDVAAAWIEYVPDTDRFNFTIQVESTDGLRAPAVDYQILCGAEALGFVGTEWTEQRISWTVFKQEGESNFQGSVAHWSQGTTTGVSINSTYEIVFGTPGYFRWDFDRLGTQAIGDDLGAWSVRCYESWFPQGITRTATNDDTASSSATFPVGAYKPPSEETGDDGPRLVRQAKPSPSSTGTAALSLLAAVGVLATVAIWGRKIA